MHSSGAAGEGIHATEKNPATRNRSNNDNHDKITLYYYARPKVCTGKYPMYISKEDMSMRGSFMLLMKSFASRWITVQN